MTIRKISLTTGLALFIALAGLAGAQAVGTEDIYISASGSGTAGGISFDDVDIVLCDRFGGVPGTCIWSMFFDGSAEGVSNQSDLAAFHVQDDDNILMSFKTPKKIGGLRKVDDSDIVHFDRTAGNPNSAYTFYFDGSDVDLTTDDESIDAIGFDRAGRLVISTDGDYSVPKTGGGTLSGVDADLIVFNGSTGPSTSGDFELYFDGASAGFNTPQEDIWGVWIDNITDEVYLTTRGDFSVGTLNGVGTDILVCEPAGFNPIPSCTTVTSFFVSSDEDYNDKIIDGLFIVNNTPPVAQDDLFTMLEDGVLNGNVLADNGNGIDDDPDGDPLTVNTTPVSGPSDGTLVLLADGNFTYTPFADFNGTDMFEYEIDDGNGGTDIGKVTITVTAVNDVPSFTKGANETVLEDAGAQTVVGWATGISAGPPDEAGQILTFSVTNNTDAALFAAGPSINSITGTLTYTAAADANGTADITIELMDDGGVADGGVDTSAPQTFTINVTAVNDAPSFTKGADETSPENAGAQTVVGWATAISAGPSDESGQTLSFNVTGNTDPTLFTAGPGIDANGDLTYTAADDANGTSDITIELMDDGGTADGGMDTSAPQTFNITITAVNNAPSFTKGADETVLEDAGPQTVVGWATGISAGPPDEAGQTLTFNVTGNTDAALFAAGPSINSSGDLTYTTAADANGSADVTIELMDDGGTADGGVDTSAPQTFTINVTAVNDVPSFTKGGNQLILEDAGAQSVPGWATGISAGPTDESGQTLAFNVTGNTNAGLFAAGPSIDSTGTLAYTTAAGVNGMADITIELMDNGGTADGGVDTSAPQTFNITITAVNNAPSFTKGADETVLEDAGPQTVVGWVTGISAGPPDEAGQTLTFNVTGNTNGALFAVGPSIDSTGTLTYTTSADAFGTADITIVLMDNGGTADGGADTSAPQTFTINVLPVNDMPSFIKGSDQTVQHDAGTQTVIGWATGISVGPVNESGQIPSFNITNNTNTSLFATQPVVSAIGTLTYTPMLNASGTATITLNVMDDGGMANGGIDTSTTQMFDITVNTVIAPTANNDTFASLGNVGIDFLAVSGALFADNGSGADDDGGGTLVVSQVQGSAVNVGAATATSMSGSVTANADGSFSYVPAAGFEGADTFTYTAMNVAGDSQAMVTINVSGMIWFIDNTAGAGDGRLNTPFNTLAAFQAVNGNGGANDPAAGDDIFLYTGSGSYTGGVTLESTQQLIGQGTPGASLASVLGITEPTQSYPLPAINGTRPVIGDSSGTAVTLATNDTVSGLNVTMTGSAQGVVGSALGTSTAINNVSIDTGTGTALSLSNGNAIVTLDSVTSTAAGANTAIVLSNTGVGEIAINGGTISNKTVDAITLNDTDGQVILSNMIIQDIGVATDTTDPLNTRSGRDGIHGQVVSGGLTLDGVTIRRISDMCVNGALFTDGVSATTWNGLDIIDSTIEDCNRWHVAGTGDTSAEGAVRIVGLTGVVNIDNSTIQRAGELLDLFTDSSGGLTMEVTNSDFNDAYKEFTSGIVASVGKMCIDVTVEGSSSANVTIGGAGGGNNFLNCGLASLRVTKDTVPAGSSAIEFIVDSNTFRVNDHSSTMGTDGNFPQGGVLLRAGPGGITTFDAIVSNNTFGVAVGPDDDVESTTDEIMNADGLEGNLGMVFESGASQVRVNNNTFNGSINAPWFHRADGNASAKVLYQSNGYRGRGDFNSPDPSFGTFRVPGIPYRTRVRNNGNLDITFVSDQFALHDQFFWANTETLEFESRVVGGTMCVALNNTSSPDGYEFDELFGTINLYQGAVDNAATGPCTPGVTSDCQNELADDGVRGGALDAALSPPLVDVDNGSISIVPSACTLPSGGIFNP